MKWTIAWLTVGILSATAIVPSARQVVSITLRGHYYAEPATVRITVAVEPDPDHRALIIEADSDQYFRSSAVMLDGDQEKRLHSVEFKNLPAGAYVLRAQVRSVDEVLATATQELFVTGTRDR